MKDNKKIDLTKANREDIIKLMNDIENSNGKLEDYFDEERKKWNNLLSTLYAVLSKKDINAITELQANVLSLRQKIQEDISIYMNRLTKENSKLRKAKADRMEYYMYGFGLKTGSTEKTMMIDRDLNEKKRNVELLESHIEYLRECRYSCDQIQYAVKNLVGLLNYI